MTIPDQNPRGRGGGGGVGAVLFYKHICDYFLQQNKKEKKRKESKEYLGVGGGGGQLTLCPSPPGGYGPAIHYIITEEMKG